ncbi:uncharacterized protein LOC120707183 isoform X3 [Panicum virgatum]|uniref:uncharacterized protein LOC120707183 isoform X3 n=1 Tax=Panicum virgatum TaxID=38727 RepID=UPI0019D5B207|nr:uncharacterized protein LOC120707183 isoform X3 [Panicum virgatum]
MRRIFRFFLHFSPSPLVHLAPIASAACRRPSLSRPLEPLGCSLPGRRRTAGGTGNSFLLRHRGPCFVRFHGRRRPRSASWLWASSASCLGYVAGNGLAPSRSFASVRRGRKGRQPPAGTSRHYGRREVCLLHARAAPSLPILRGSCLRFDELHLYPRGMWRGFRTKQRPRKARYLTVAFQRLGFEPGQVRSPPGGRTNRAPFLPLHHGAVSLLVVGVCRRLCSPPDMTLAVCYRSWILGATRVAEISSNFKDRTQKLGFHFTVPFSSEHWF